jgi:hypothetical protein
VLFEPDKVQIKMDRGKSVSTLAVDIEIPNLDQMSGLVPRYNRPNARPDNSVFGMEGSEI